MEVDGILWHEVARERGFRPGTGDHMAEQPTLFVGTHEHGLDDKGRMVLPAKIRGQLGEAGMLALLDGCVGLWTVDGFRVMAETIHQRVDAKEVSMEAFRQFMANAAEVTPDQQGRIVVPANLRDYAALGSEVVVAGRHDRAEIWDKGRWVAMTPGGNADLTRSVHELGL